MGEVEKGEILSPPVSLLSAKGSAGWAGISKNRIKEGHDKRGADKLISRAGSLRVRRALPSAAVTTGAAGTRGFLRDGAGIPEGSRRDRGSLSSLTLRGPRGPFPERRRPLQAARGAAPEGRAVRGPCKGRKRGKPELSRAHPQLHPNASPEPLKRSTAGKS